MKSEKPKILLVEDNPADINLVEEALEEAQLDCCLHIMRDGVRAVEFLEQLDAEPDRPAPQVVLLDLNLPKIGGEEVLKRVRLSPKCEGVKVMIISSSDAPGDRERMMKLGATDYFRKPSGLAQFMLLGPKVRALIEDSRHQSVRSDAFSSRSITSGRDPPLRLLRLGGPPLQASSYSHASFRSVCRNRDQRRDRIVAGSYGRPAVPHSADFW